MIKTVKSFFKNSYHFIWTTFLKGLFTILPITLTIALFSISFRLIKNWIEPVRRFEPEFFQQIPHSEIVITLLAILLLGSLLNLMIVEPIIHMIERFLFKLPLFRPVYSGIKQLVHAFNPHNTVSFKKIVLVQFPRTGMYSVGFLTGEFPSALTPEREKQLVTVFVPTTPNPTTGFFIMVPPQDIIITELTHQEAMALIISGGIIQPERFK